ncbi:MAG: OmpA family protein [Bacteroidota bacterium]|nr:OmpA family protein [Bacteroidota bacterium]
MASKKYVLLMVSLMCLFQTISFAQTSTDWGWDWKDSSKIPTQRIPQYNEFLNNQYPYPAQPRDQWELGIGLGTPALSNEWGNDFGFGANLTLRKALNHTFSLRPFVAYYSNKGSGMDANPATVGNQIAYKNNSFHVGLDVLSSLNTASYYRGNPKVNIYAITGVEYFSTSLQQSINGGAYSSFSHSGNNGIENNIGLNLGLGTAFKISNKVNFALEVKNTLTNNAYLNTYSTIYGKSNDAWWYFGAKLNINLGNPAKRVQPLWWINPNNYAYNELNAPKHMKMPKVVLPDADGDGVTDQFDLEPNTPAGAPVDSHGVSKDTDGDGVPDYRDKEPLTPRNCFPVNNDGIGNCPEPACCKELRDQISNMKLAAAECTISDLPSIHFKSGAKLSKDAEKLLAAAATKIKANPNCKVKVIGHPTASKAAQQLSYERVSAVIKYLVEKEGIAESRFIFNYDGGSGDASTIDLLGTTEDGPNTVPAPHPNLRSKG